VKDLPLAKESSNDEESVMTDEEMDTDDEEL
jgi:hypothetical protein